MEYKCGSRKVESFLANNYKMYTRSTGLKATKRLRMLIENILEMSSSMFEFLEVAKKRGGKPHKLSSKDGKDYYNCWGISICDGERLVIKPDCDPIPTLSDGSVDQKEVKNVIVVSIENYHKG